MYWPGHAAFPLYHYEGTLNKSDIYKSFWLVFRISLVHMFKAHVLLETLWISEYSNILKHADIKKTFVYNYDYNYVCQNTSTFPPQQYTQEVSKFLSVYGQRSSSVLINMSAA